MKTLILIFYTSILIQSIDAAKIKKKLKKTLKIKKPQNKKNTKKSHQATTVTSDFLQKEKNTSKEKQDINKDNENKYSILKKEVNKINTVNQQTSTIKKKSSTIINNNHKELNILLKNITNGKDLKQYLIKAINKFLEIDIEKKFSKDYTKNDFNIISNNASLLDAYFTEKIKDNTENSFNKIIETILLLIKNISQHKHTNKIELEKDIKKIKKIINEIDSDITKDQIFLSEKDFKLKAMSETHQEETKNARTANEFSTSIKTTQKGEYKIPLSENNISKQLLLPLPPSIMENNENNISEHSLLSPAPDIKKFLLETKEIMSDKESKTASIPKLENKKLENNASKLTTNQRENLLKEIENFRKEDMLKKTKTNEKTDEKVDKNNNNNDFNAEMRRKIELRGKALNKKWGYNDEDDDN